MRKIFKKFLLLLLSLTVPAQALGCGSLSDLQPVSKEEAAYEKSAAEVTDKLMVFAETPEYVNAETTVRAELEDGTYIEFVK